MYHAEPALTTACQPTRWTRVGCRRLRPRYRRSHTLIRRRRILRHPSVDGGLCSGIPDTSCGLWAPDLWAAAFGTKIFPIRKRFLHLCRQGPVTVRESGPPPVRGLHVDAPTGRDQWTRIQNGAWMQTITLTALRTDTYANMGAYLSTFAAVGSPHGCHGTLMAGNYKTPLIYVNVKAVFTNTVPVDGITRGAAGQEGPRTSWNGWLINAAHELGSDPICPAAAELYQPNFPYATPVRG